MKPKTPKTKTKAEQALDKAINIEGDLGSWVFPIKRTELKNFLTFKNRLIRRAVKEAVREAEVRHLHCGLVKQTTALVNLADAVERMEVAVAKIAAKPRRRAGGKKSTLPEV